MNLEKLISAYSVIIVLIFGLIVLHAPIVVYFGTNFSEYSLFIKAWKEMLLVLASILLCCILFKKPKTTKTLLADWIIRLSFGYIILHFLLALLFHDNANSTIAGLMIDLRFVVFFVLVYSLIKIRPKSQELLIKVFAAGGVIVIVFGLLQIFVLPINFLKNIGYGENSIMPYMTVDQNHDFIRINSTLRGPNPLGAYMVVLFSVLSAFLIKKYSKIRSNKKALVSLVLGAIGSLIVLWSTYSRAAALACGVALAVLLFTILCHRLNKKTIILIVCGLGATAVFLGIFVQNNEFLSHVILHKNPNSNVETDSNKEHLASLSSGLGLMLSQPLGAGVGSTGSASLLTKNPLIIENQYLYIAHEAGWLGLGVFIVLFGLIMIKLYRKSTNHWLAAGILASGAGLAVIGLVLPVWADDTVAIVWWGLAAVCLSFITPKVSKKYRQSTK